MYALPKLMSLSLARSFLVLSTEMHSMTLSSFFSVLRLVRVLDVMKMLFRKFPAEILQLVNLRFLAINCYGRGRIPRGISRLWNLQTLIALMGSGSMPFEIWQLSELRQLELQDDVMLFKDEYVKQIVHKKLQTISSVRLTRSLIRNAFLEGIPNIKDLEICCSDKFKLSGVDLSHLHKLETLRCESTSVRDSLRFWSTLKFPFALRKLSLREIAMFPRVSMLLCALLNLEVLEIRSCRFKRKDEELEAVEEEEREAAAEEKTLPEDEGSEEALSGDEEENEELEEAAKDEDEDEEWEIA